MDFLRRTLLWFGITQMVLSIRHSVQAERSAPISGITMWCTRSYFSETAKSFSEELHRREVRNGAWRAITRTEVLIHHSAVETALFPHRSAVRTARRSSGWLNNPTENLSPRAISTLAISGKTMSRSHASTRTEVSTPHSTTLATRQPTLREETTRVAVLWFKPTVGSSWQGLRQTLRMEPTSCFCVTTRTVRLTQILAPSEKSLPILDTVMILRLRSQFRLMANSLSVGAHLTATPLISVWHVTMHSPQTQLRDC